jgi:hypothetical protein
MAMFGGAWNEGGSCVVLEEFDIASWHGPFEPQTRARAQAALEQGRLLFLLSGASL